MTTAYSIYKPAASFKSHKSVSPYGSPLPPSPPHKRQNSHVASQLGVIASSLDSVRTDVSSNSRDVIVADQWLVLARIGEGSFGEVFEAQDVDTGRHCAIKREPLNVPFPQLKHESLMYDVLAGGRGIPKCEWYGEHDEYACIVIDLLGPSLKHLLDVVSYVPLDIIVDLSCQMVSILEHIHNRGLVYRDVKPENFLFPARCTLPDFDLHDQEDQDVNGSSTTSTTPYYQLNKPTCQEVFEQWGEVSPMLSVVDFGLAMWWRNPTTGKPYPQARKRIKHKTGTARYASLNVHRGKLHARRDDIESLGYLILDMTLGSLPWTGVHARNSKAGWDRMRELKEETDLHELCVGLPRGFLEFVQYARRLRFHDQPDYEHLRGLLKGSLAGGKYSELIKSGFFSGTAVNDNKEAESAESGNRRNGSGNSCPAQGSGGRNYASSSKRRPSLKSSFQPRYGKQQEGVFVMDDLANELPALENGNGKASQHGNGRTANSQRRRPSSSNRKPRSRQDSNGGNKKHPQHPGAPPSPPRNVSSSSAQQQQKSATWRTRKHQKPSVGWNTHRHNQMHAVPGAIWETAPLPPTLATWGENKANAIWGHTGNPL